MARKAEQLSDKEAAQRLKAIAMAACEGVRDIANDRAYKAARRQFVGRIEYADVLPAFLRAQRDLNLLWQFLRDYSISRADRRSMVIEAFEPMLERVAGRTKPPFRSAGWTGRRTAAQQAQIVMALGPTAFEAVEMLLDDQERGLHNGPPVEPARMEAIQRLRELHTALGELITLAQQGRPIGHQLRSIRAAKDKLLHWSSDAYALCMGPVQLMGPSAVFGSALWFLTNLITKDLEASAAFSGAIAAGASAVSVAKGGATPKRRPRSPRP